MTNRYCVTCGAGLTADDADSDLCGSCRAGVMTQDLTAPGPADAATVIQQGAPVDPQRPQRGQILGDRYELRRELGRGGMGMVWLAQDTDLNLDVAIKLLPPEVASDRRAQDELRKEAQRSITLSHPNIVKLHTYRNQGDLQYLVMEFVDGPSLDHHLYDHGPIAEAQLAQWLMDVCRGLAEAHHQGVIHRDIKPHNVLIGKDGRAKIADFGIARVMSDSTLRASGTISGTPLYMSPEQIRGEQCDARSDLYSLGVAAYQLASGDVPFRTGDVAYQHMQVAPEPIAEQAPSLWPIVQRLLAKDPDERIASADDLADALIDSGLVQGTRSPSRPAPVAAKKPVPDDGAATAPTRVLGAPASGSATPARRSPAIAAIAAVVIVGAFVLFGLRPDGTEDISGNAPENSAALATRSEPAVQPTPIPEPAALEPAEAISEGEPVVPAPAPPSPAPAPAVTPVVPAPAVPREPPSEEPMRVASIPPEQMQEALDEAAAAAKALSPEVARIPASDVLAIAYGAYPPEAPVGTPSPALQLEIFARREGEDTFKVLKDGDELASQVDDYVIMARTLSAGYLYVFQIDSLGNKYWLFPKNEQAPISGGENPVPASEIMQVPGGNSVQALFLDENVGVEHIYAVFSATPWPELEKALAEGSQHMDAVSPAAAAPEDTRAPDRNLTADAAAGEETPRRFEVAMAITEPNRLTTRGIGGTRPAPAAVEAAIRFEDETFMVPVASEPMAAEGHFLVVERWFHHVAPE